MKWFIFQNHIPVVKKKIKSWILLKVRVKRPNSCWYIKFVTNADLRSWKLGVYILDISKLKPALVDLSNASDVVKQEVFKKGLCMINWLKS